MLQNLRWLAVPLLVAAAPSFAAAEFVRFHFVPADACGATSQVPIGPEGSMGELKRLVVLEPSPTLTSCGPHTW